MSKIEYWHTRTIGQRLVMLESVYESLEAQLRSLEMSSIFFVTNYELYQTLNTLANKTRKAMELIESQHKALSEIKREYKVDEYVYSAR